MSVERDKNELRRGMKDTWGPNFDSKDSKNPNKNRILFDDIKVMVPR